MNRSADPQRHWLLAYLAPEWRALNDRQEPPKLHLVSK